MLLRLVRLRAGHRRLPDALGVFRRAMRRGVSESNAMVRFFQIP
jgi:hypothetical protein